MAAARSSLLLPRLVARARVLWFLGNNRLRESAFMVPVRHLSFSPGLPQAKKEWFEVTYERADGTQFTVKGKDGDNLLDIAVNNDLDLEGFGACEGTLACSTCHLIFKKEDFGLIEEPCTDEELDMLDLAYGLTNTNRCVSLSGCGFLGVYIMGALDCLKRYSPRFLHTAVIAGASAGALLGASVVCDVPLNGVRDGFLRTAVEARKWKMGVFTPGFKFENYLSAGLDALPSDAHIKASGRLYVSVTRVHDMSNVIISEWESREDLIQTLRCSCFIFGFSGLHPPILHGVRYMDGGYTNKQPELGHNTVSVSPYSGCADISPKENEGLGQLKWANHGMNVSYGNVLRLYRTLMPPPPYILNHYYHYGYEDAFHFLRKNGRFKH